MEEFILKDIYGKTSEFYISESMKLIRKSSLNFTDTLAENVSGEYSIFNTDDFTGVVYQSVSGELIYIKIYPDTVKRFVLLKTKNYSQPFSKITTIYTNNTLHILYILSHNRKNLLIHQKISSSLSESPKVIGELSSYSYSAVLSQKNNTLHILFIDRLNHISHKEYDIRFGVYTDQYLYIEDHPIDIACCEDNTGCMHVFSVNKKLSYYTINYYNINLGTKKTVGFGTENFQSIFCWHERDRICTVWKDNISKYETTNKTDAPMIFTKARPIHIKTQFKKCIINTNQNLSYERLSSLS